ncbi:hypothetical protein V6N11_000285 [Hibiscus sabdariffa]|uniref:Uncharacterized protein n=1 Tax=Hibiscus sabdariffa TaxID=183260 RepID=A0ABR2NFS8_9ROSI
MFVASWRSLVSWWLGRVIFSKFPCRSSLLILDCVWSKVLRWKTVVLDFIFSGSGGLRCLKFQELFSWLWFSLYGSESCDLV